MSLSGAELECAGSLAGHRGAQWQAHDDVMSIQKLIEQQLSMQTRHDLLNNGQTESEAG
jgi:hypothetical protein